MIIAIAAHGVIKMQRIIAFWQIAPGHTCFLLGLLSLGLHQGVDRLLNELHHSLNNLNITQKGYLF